MHGAVLTFDDGPSDSTAEILDLLKLSEIRATFFVIGARAKERPDLVKRASDEGHTIGNHTWNHVALLNILNDATDADDLQRRMGVVRDELARTSELIASILGASPTVYRGPWLNIDVRVDEIAAELGLSHVAVDVDTCDYDERYDAEAVATAISRAGPGQIVLLHDGNGDAGTEPANPARPKTVDALRMALAKREG